MNLVDRVKNILFDPKAEWPKIAPEPATTQSMYVGYIMILAAIGPIAILLRSFAYGFGIVPALLTYVIALAVIFFLSLIVDALAPTFGGERDFIQSLKLTAYACTAAWVAGIFNLFGFLGSIIGLFAAIYSFYTFYLGAPVMKKCPQEKAAAYTIVVIICAFVLGLVLREMLFAMFVGGVLGVGAGMSR